jgi:putative phage-type endonuclease
LSRKEFLEARRAGIGSSDVAPILGLSPWKSALSVYLDKIGESADQPMTPPQEWGVRAEPMIAAAIIDKYGWELSKPLTMKHRSFGFLIASPDRMTDKGDVIEIKTARTDDGWGEAETADVPEHYWLQVQHQLEVADADTCWVFVLIGSSDFRRYRVQRDPGYLPAVIEPLAEFWESVQSRTPMEPDWSSPLALRSVERLHKHRAGDRVALSAEAARLASEYERLGEEAKAIEEQRGTVKARLIHAMGGAEFGMLPDGRSIVRRSVEREAYTVKATNYYSFRIQKGKG